MAIQDLKAHIKKFAPDIKRNLDLLFYEGKTPGLTEAQTWAVALACSYSIESHELTEYIENYAARRLTDEQIDAIKSAVAIQVVRNCYNQSIYLSDNEALSAMSPRLYEEILEVPPMGELDFHFYTLACSIVNSSAKCIQLEMTKILEHGGSMEAVHTIIRIAAVLKGTAQVLGMQ